MFKLNFAEVPLFVNILVQCFLIGKYNRTKLLIEISLKLSWKSARALVLHVLLHYRPGLRYTLIVEDSFERHDFRLIEKSS